MASYNNPMGGMVYGSPPNDSRIEELEQKVEELEKLVNRLIKSNKPSFQDFKFIKEDEEKKDREVSNKLRQIMRTAEMFSR
jgi:DNA-binding ferritin-like protein